MKEQEGDSSVQEPPSKRKLKESEFSSHKIRTDDTSMLEFLRGLLLDLDKSDLADLMLLRPMQFRIMIQLLRNYATGNEILLLRQQIFASALEAADSDKKIKLEAFFEEQPSIIESMEMKWIHVSQPLLTLIQSDEHKMYIRSIFNILDFQNSDVAGVEMWIYYNSDSQKLDSMVRMDSQFERFLGYEEGPTSGVRERFDKGALNFEIQNPETFHGPKVLTVDSLKSLLEQLLHAWMKNRTNLALKLEVTRADFSVQKCFAFVYTKDLLQEHDAIMIGMFARPLTSTFNPALRFGSSFSPSLFQQ